MDFEIEWQQSLVHQSTKQQQCKTSILALDY